MDRQGREGMREGERTKNLDELHDNRCDVDLKFMSEGSHNINGSPLISALRRQRQADLCEI